MADLPHPWGAYMRLQAVLSHRTQVDDVTWGYEAGLNRILDPSNVEHPNQNDIDRAVASGARQDRYRAQLRAVHLHEVESVDSNVDQPLPIAETRQTLQAIKNRVTYSDWILLCKIAVGHKYTEIAALQQETAGHLRVRLLRLRRSLVSLAA